VPSPGQFEHWQGDLLVSSLKRQTLHRLRFDDGRVMYEEAIEIGHRIRDLLTLDSGEIVLVTDDHKIILLLDADVAYGPNMKRGEVLAALPFVVRPADEDGADVVADAASGEEIFAERCAACHSLDGALEISVPLNGLFRRRIGSVDGFAYSDVLARDQRKWDAHKLRTFLLKGSEKFPGTTMPDPNLTPAEVAALTSFLARLE
jgi:cytochrome c2